MYTRCPQCHTTFRLTATQLKAAQGMVRCGHCQAVFQAMDSLFDRPEPRQEAPQSQLNHEALNRLNEVSPAVSPAEPTPVAPAPVMEPEPTYQAPGAATTPTPEAPPLPGQLESLSALFAEQAPTVAARPAPEPAVEELIVPSEGRAESLPPDNNAPAFMPWPEPAATHVPSALPITPASESHHRDETDATTARSAETPVPPPPTVKFEPPVAPSFEPPAANMAAVPQPTQDESKTTPNSAATGGPGESATDAFMAALREAQQQASTLAEAANKPMPYAIPERPGWKPVLALAAWLIGSLALLVLLGLQYAYFNRDTLSQNPLLRPALEAMCLELRCTLPLREDISKFELRDRKVESHPSESNGLMITAQIVNRADFVQPYPELEITFKNLQDKLIVKRSFLPEEYLQGVDISRGFPASQYVSIVLEIVDPGPIAINYYFEFKPGKQPMAKK